MVVFNIVIGFLDKFLENCRRRRLYAQAMQRGLP
jgi:hypothetical protein